MLNIDCRKFLVQHATHFVERYEKDKSNKSNKADAIYFVNKLKESDTKAKLLERLKHVPDILLVGIISYPITKSICCHRI